MLLNCNHNAIAEVDIIIISRASRRLFVYLIVHLWKLSNMFVLLFLTTIHAKHLRETTPFESQLCNFLSLICIKIHKLLVMSASRIVDCLSTLDHIANWPIVNTKLTGAPPFARKLINRMKTHRTRSNGQLIDMATCTIN